MWYARTSYSMSCTWYDVTCNVGICKSKSTLCDTSYHVFLLTEHDTRFLFASLTCCCFSAFIFFLKRHSLTHSAVLSPSCLFLTNNSINCLTTLLSQFGVSGYISRNSLQYCKVSTLALL